MYFGGLGGIVMFALMIYCLFDAISTDSSTVQNLPKIVWVLLIIFVPIVGPVAWLLLGRPAGASFKIGSTDHRPMPPSSPPPQGFSEPPMSADDYQRRREEMLQRYEAEREEKLRQREEEIARREEELRRKEQGLE